MFEIISRLSRIGDNFFNYNWSIVYNSPIAVFEVSKVYTSLIGGRVPSEVIRLKVNDKVWFNKGCVEAFYKKQNIYRSLFLWDEFVMYRHHAQTLQ